MATLTTIITRCQSFLNDYDATTIDQTHLLPLINAAQDEVGEELRNRGVDRMRFRTTFTVTAGTTTVTPGTSPFTATNCIIPTQLWEATVGAANQYYITMTGPTLLPFIPQATVLGFWDWYGGGISLIGSTTDRSLMVDYDGTLTDFSSPSDVVALQGAANAIAYKTCQMWAASRQENSATEYFANEAEASITRIANQEIQDLQSVPLRRLPMRQRYRYIGM
jgi:hypothetical protein